MKEQTSVNQAAEIASRLLQIKAIKLSPQRPFTWASGLQSPIYCDNRILLSYPDHRWVVVDALVDASEQFEDYDFVAGVATAGIAHGVLLANAMELPFAYVRSKPKGHGRQNLIEGEISKGARILVVEDLISTGKSSLAAVEALRNAGHQVIGVLAIFSYGLPVAKSAFDEANCPLHTITNYEVLLNTALSSDYITENQLASLKAWKEDPQRWSEDQK